MALIDIRDRDFSESDCLAFGFHKNGDVFQKEFPFHGGDFRLDVKIRPGDSLENHLFDVSTGDEFIHHLLPGSKGTFTSEMKEEYEQAIDGILSNCFKKRQNANQLIQEIIAYAKARYDDDPEWPWEEDIPTAFIIRRKQTRKWYVLIMEGIKQEKLGLSGEKTLPIMNLHGTKEGIDALVDGVRYFRAYHMNKKTWFTIPLDGRVGIEELKPLIDISFALAKK